MIKEAKIVSVVSLFPLPQYVVVLEDVEKTRLVPIWIGINEGNAIALELQGEKFPRPLTHDLLVNVINATDSQVTRLIIDKLETNTFFAKIEIKRPGAEAKLVDCRPSDGIAVAVRIKCPIFVDEDVLSKASMMKH